MQMRKSVLIGMAIASLWAATGFVQPAWSQGREGYARQHGLVSLIFRVANLNDAQKAQVRSIFQNERLTLQGLRSTLRDCRSQLTTAILEQSDTQQPLQCVTNTQASITQEHVNSLRAIVALLMPDQLSDVVAAKNQLSALRQQAQQVLKGNSSPQ